MPRICLICLSEPWISCMITHSVSERSLIHRGRKVHLTALGWRASRLCQHRRACDALIASCRSPATPDAQRVPCQARGPRQRAGGRSLPTTRSRAHRGLEVRRVLGGGSVGFVQFGKVAVLNIFERSCDGDALTLDNFSNLLLRMAHQDRSEAPGTSSSRKHRTPIERSPASK